MARNQLQERDWMRELEADAIKMQSVMQRVDELARKALFDVAQKRYNDAGMRLLEIREGLTLICELCNVKIVQLGPQG